MNNYFDVAYKEAVKAYKKREIPVGAVIVKNGVIIAKSHNNRQKKHNVLGHAEINVILKAEKKLKDWRLDGCTMYVTLEPCDMCKTIIKESRIDKVFFLMNKLKDKNQNLERCEKIAKNYEMLMQDFFKKLRNKIIK